MPLSLDGYVFKKTVDETALLKVIQNTSKMGN